MKNKNILLTGGHSGMGLELTKILIREGHKIGLVVRSEKRKKDAINALGKSSNVDFFLADLGNRAEIQQVVVEIKAHWEKIDVIFNNSGVLLDKLYMSDYGTELQLEINAISPYLLTKGLFSLLEKSENPLVVNTATSALQKKKSIDIEKIRSPKKFTKLTGSYMDSKLMMVLLMNNLSEKNTKIQIVSVNPGAIKTKMTAGDGMPFWLKPIRNLLFKNPEEGAKALYDGAFGGNLKESGVYSSNGREHKLALKLTESQINQLLSI